jgi:hypothetical protein
VVVYNFVLKIKYFYYKFDIRNNTNPMKSSRRFKTPQGAMPTLITLALSDAFDVGMTLSKAAETCRTTPASIPDVKIQAPVVLAAFNRP